MLGKTRAVLIGVVLVAVAINVAQFRSIDDATDGGYTALSRLSSTDIMEDAITDPVIARTYGLYVNLAATAPGARILVSLSGNIFSPAFRDHVLSLGEAQDVRFADFDETANSVLSPEDLLTMEKYQVAATGAEQVDGRTVTRWQIVTGECASAASPASAPEFAVMWMNAEGSGFMLLIETCLLPEGTVTEE